MGHPKGEEEEGRPKGAVGERQTVEEEAAAEEGDRPQTLSEVEAAEELPVGPEATAASCREEGRIPVAVEEVVLVAVPQSPQEGEGAEDLASQEAETGACREAPLVGDPAEANDRGREGAPGAAASCQSPGAGASEAAAVPLTMEGAVDHPVGRVAAWDGTLPEAAQ